MAAAANRSFMKGSDRRFMLLAIKKAKQGIRKGQTPFGACIAKNNRAISCAHNVVWKNIDITAHAEINAIRIACKKLKTINLSGCTIYSTCEPCPMCFSAIHWAKISKIAYGTGIADAKRAGFNELAISDEKMKMFGRSKVKIIKDFMKEENAELFGLWKRQKGRRAY